MCCTVGMEYSRFLDCLAADFARLRVVVSTGPTATVPSCPGLRRCIVTATQ
jgi:hypothetical protein